ncbi:hypothetical protein HA402_015682 [Bradysia odoriphaga]|nr:hypothetical protein HA402_015682 [Bradysia odoriphaga]
MQCSTKYAGCYCVAPYVRSDNGGCVLTSQCEPTPTCTRVHEKYLSCSNGCQTTCQNYNNPPICTMECSTAKAGCYCEAGYVRSDSGDCVLTSQCEPTPTCTRVHEKYLSCSNGCQTTCQNYNNPPICTMECSTAKAGCYCEAGYVRSDSGDCVLSTEC